MTTTAGSLDPTTYPPPAPSVGRMLQQRVADAPGDEAYRFPLDGAWESVTWAQVWETVRGTAAGLLALGLGPEDRVAIASGTRVEWLYADLAVMCAGAATTAVYPTTNGDDVAFILGDSGARVAFAEDDVQIAKLRSRREHLPDLVRVITFDGTSDGEWVLSLADLQALGAKLLVEDEDAVERAVAAVEPEQLATLIYTSGTTGRPKGVELPHRCWTYLAAAAEAIELLSPTDLQYLWLPLAHSFGKMLATVQLRIGFATAVDGRIDRIMDNLAVVRPTFMAGPPRIFEKVHAAVTQKVQDSSRTEQRLFAWALRTGQRMTEARAAGRRPAATLVAQAAVADRLVLSRVRARLGGRIRLLLSGSAPLSKEVSSWFAALGLGLLEGYGLTETGGGACIRAMGDMAFGTVGRPVPGTEVSIAGDGEILIRGPLVMQGYHNLPDVTSEVLSEDGWFATGDVGQLDAAGRLRVTDRKKDLIKTSNGKYIAPQVIEVMFKALCPLASQMLVHGDNRNYATALVTLDPDALAQWGRTRNLPETDYASLSVDPSVQEYVQTCVNELNSRLNRWETIKDFRILDRDLSVEQDELTPSLKIKRKIVEAKFWNFLDSMYNDRAGV